MGADLFAALREGREGSQFARSLRVLWFLFNGWCFYDGKRKDCAGESSTGHLRAIYFDKFAVLTARIWDAYFQRTGQRLKGKLDAAEDATLDSVVASPFPFREVPGKHGRGLARWDGKEEPRYIVDLLHRLRQEEILYYFDIDAPYGPADYRTVVKPGTPITDRRDLKEFTGLEKAVLLELANVLKKLGPSEIRALGTHSTVKKTIEDIDKEFSDLERLRVWPNLIEAIEQDGNFSEPAEQLLEYAEEAWRKAVHNEDDYTTGRVTALTESADSELQAVIKDCQQEPMAIWGDSEVRARGARAARLRSGACYVRALARFRERPRERSFRIPKSMVWELWDAGNNGLAGSGLHALPSAPTDAFEGDSENIKSAVRNDMIRLLNVLR